MRVTVITIIALGLTFAGCAGEDPFEQARREASPGAFGVGTDLESAAEPSSPAAERSEPAAESPPSGANSADSEMSPQPGQRDDAGPAFPPSEPPSQPSAPPTQPEPQPEAAQAQPPARNVEREVADVGASGKSQYDPSIITMPVYVYFRSQDATVFRMQIPKAMQLYKATTGHAPKSHEEFMQQIIKANMIQLPKLPEGERYVYDPKTEQLMVEKPTN